MKLNREIFITTLFCKLGEKYSYAIIHHINNIFKNSSDIDFIVDCNKNQMLLFIKEFTSKNNCLLGNHYMIDINIYRFDIIFFNENNLEKIELDCACNSKGNDLLNINTKNLLRNKILIKIEDKEFYKTSNDDEIEYYIRKKAFKNSDISNYYNYLNKLNSNYTETKIRNKYENYKNYFRTKKFKLKFILTKLTLLIYRILNTQSISICLLGPDGSGKSTIIELIEKKSFFINNYYFHLKPKKNNKRTQETQVDDPHKEKPYNGIKSYLKLLFFIGQYNYGWIKNILKLKIKSSLIIFDRYYDDLLVDTKRYKFGGNLTIAKIVKYFIPKPDLYFILTTDADIIYKRKQEVPFKELERQINEYKKLGDNKKYFNIDVNRTPEEISNGIIKIIARKMNERF